MRPLQNSRTDIVSTSTKEAYVRDIYLQHREELCCHIVKKCGVKFSEAEDIVHSAFARFVGMESPFAVENPRAFLYTTSYNIAIDLKRHNQVQHKYTQAVVDNDSEIVEALGPEREVEGKQRLGIISRALWGMPKKRRQLLMMSRFDGLSYAEIARQVGLSETVVRKHVSNALADCHKALQAQG
ncbi:MAG: sigma-70 family RNA polymerase sigma factor [Gammaproteobacteria bacterium]|nr:MAG: sigma-70 family RNA polymerase sigma factor [Gammaproteobacteria bacterium]